MRLILGQIAARRSCSPQLEHRHETRSHGRCHAVKGFSESYANLWDKMCVFSPFEVQVSEDAGPQKVRAWGPGLETGMVGKSADFVVEAIGTEVGTLGKLLAADLQVDEAGLKGDTRSLRSKLLCLWYVCVAGCRFLHRGSVTGQDRV